MFSQKGRDKQVKATVSSMSLPERIHIRAWREEDFESIKELSQAEGWPTPQERPDETLTAWRHSWPTLVAVDEAEGVIGFIRALTDSEITTYIAEFLVAPHHRGTGIGKALLHICHLLFPRTRFDLLSTESANQFYQANRFRSFQGFRKNF